MQKKLEIAKENELKIIKVNYFKRNKNQKPWKIFHK